MVETNERPITGSCMRSRISQIWPAPRHGLRAVPNKYIVKRSQYDAIYQTFVMTELYSADLSLRLGPMSNMLYIYTRKMTRRMRG